mmetsp:Transcript_21992/g.18858  ORF Transcript_21992/g.18858 Transcript_21992/m.18858 type:complete len:201 (-) Transcript_21992:14-616(-)
MIPGTAFYEQLAEQNQISEPSFGLYFTKVPNQPGSALVVGGIDYSHNSSAFEFYSMNSTFGVYYWSINMNNFSLGSASSSIPGLAIVNSLSPYIGVSGDFINQINDAIPAEVSCTKILSYPNLIIYPSEGSSLSVSPAFYYQATTSGKCIRMITEMTADIPGYIYLGTPFLRAYYTHYDFINQQIGIATSKIINQEVIDI